jgi:hypothetical protein
MGYGDALRDELRSDSVTPLIGIFDMYSASLPAQHSNPLSMEFSRHRAICVLLEVRH